MNILTKAIDEIKWRIPFELLQIAFKDDVQDWRRSPVSLDDKILTKIIRPRVLIDANLVGGQTIIVSLEGLTPKYIDTYTIVYEIPAEKVLYRTIMAVLSIGYLPFSTAYNSMGAGMGSVNPNTMSDILSAAQRVGDSVSNIPPISNGSVELIGYNTILVRDQLRVTNAYQLRCVIGNDENLNNISPRSYHVFSRLCELAVKSYIYNKLIVGIDQAYLTGGQVLGEIKNLVDSYADAEENYRTHLDEVWRPTAFANDNMSYQRFIKLQISPGV